MIHNFGGTIRSKSGKMLTVPIHKLARGKTAADMQRYFDAVYIQRSGGKLFIMGKNGTRGKPVALFVLKDSVKIPKREFMGLSPAAKDRLTVKTGETLR
jgi:phage gpG-like protein